MQPHRFVMHPVGNNQINPLYNPPIPNPANPLTTYQVSLQVRQYGALRMNPPYNPQVNYPMNTCPYPPGNPRMINPQLMGPVPPMNQQMIPMPNPSVNLQNFPNMNRLPVPSMNGPPGMPHRPPNMPPGNLSQPVPNLNPHMMPPMNCQSFQPVNSQNIRPPISHIPPMPPPMSQPIQAVNPPNYPPNVNYPNMPIPNPQNGPPVRGPMNTPMVYPQNCPSVNPENCPPYQNPQNFPPQNPQKCPPPLQNPHIFPPSQNPPNFLLSQSQQNFSASLNSQNFPPLQNHGNIPPLQRPQNCPSPSNPQNLLPLVNLQNNQNAQPMNEPAAKKQKSKKKKKSGTKTTIFWEDPDHKKSRLESEENALKAKKSKTLMNGVNKPKKGKLKEEVKNEDKKKEEKKVVTAKPNDNAPSSSDSKTNDTPLVTIKAKGDSPLDEKKTEYFKNLKSSKAAPGKDQGKKKHVKSDKAKTKILKIFSLMQKFKGVCKKLWQNVAANGEFKDCPGIHEEVIKFLKFSHKFLAEVDCIVQLTKKEEPSSKEMALEKADGEKLKGSQVSKNDSKSKKNEAALSVAKTIQQRRTNSIPFRVKFCLKKLDELDALGLCFVNINGIFIKRYCSVIVKLRKSLLALLEKSKTSLRNKRLRIPKRPCLPRWSAIILTCHGSTSYEKALQMALSGVKFKPLGIQCIKQRRSLTGGVILQVFADTDHEAKADILAEKLKELYASLEVKVTRPRNHGELVVKRLDSSATVEQICEQLAKLGNCSADVFKTGSRGKTCMWVKCPVNIALELDQKTFKMESTVARIDLKSKKFIRCYKCFNVGHVKELCPSPLDRNNLCFKCGQKDHEAKTCQNAPICLTCYDNSLPNSHRLGGENCPSAIPKVIRRPDDNPGQMKGKKKGSKVKNGNKGKKTKNKSISCLPSAPDEVRSRN